MKNISENIQKLLPERRLYVLRSLPHHLAASNEVERLQELLTTYDFIKAKVRMLGPQLLIEDYAYVTDQQLRLIQGALRLSAHVLAVGPQELSAQLFGRLGAMDGIVIQALIEQARQDQENYLYPVAASLAPPGETLERIIPIDADAGETVAITPDGAKAVAPSANHILSLWDTSTGVVERTLTGHTDMIRAAAITEDGKLAFSASVDKTFRVWDLQTGKAIKTLNGHSESRDGMAITPDGRLAISAGAYGYPLKIWDLHVGKAGKTLRGHSELVRSVSITPDHQTVVSASWDHTVRVWDLPSGRTVHILRGAEVSGEIAAITPDGKKVITAAEDHSLVVWNLKLAIKILTLVGHKSGPGNRSFQG
jgi:hypothetical protein